ncbi:cyclohexanecarboxylate-CoA ligase, partial [Streptosporangium sp. NPDC051023]
MTTSYAGPTASIGYFDSRAATNEAYVDRVWFRTGDRAGVDERGWLSLSGRTKDIVIRGGENIPVTEIESIVFEHPDVLSAALVGISDERLGERLCAVLVMRPGVEDLSVEGLAAFLLARG